MRVVTPSEDEFRIAIEFNRSEAEALNTVCDLVSGDIKDSARKHFDQLRRILLAAGVAKTTRAHGDIRFD